MNQRKRALVCMPGNTLDRGLKMIYRGKLDVDVAKEQHQNYCKELQNFRYNLVVMPEDADHPDSVFVEDPGVIVGNTLIITRLRCKERQGEEKNLERALAPIFKKIAHIQEPGFVEGGDVLVTHDTVYVGISKRTNEEGAEQLIRLAHDAAGYKGRAFAIPDDYLHLKGEVTFHKKSLPGKAHALTVSEEIADHFQNSGCTLIPTPADERFAGNCISSGGKILIHAGREKSRRIIERYGFKVKEIDLSEFEKIDGAMTCLSKLF